MIGRLKVLITLTWWWSEKISLYYIGTLSQWVFWSAACSYHVAPFHSLLLCDNALGQGRYNTIQVYVTRVSLSPEKERVKILIKNVSSIMDWNQSSTRRFIYKVRCPKEIIRTTFTNTPTGIGQFVVSKGSPISLSQLWIARNIPYLHMSNAAMPSVCSLQGNPYLL